MVHFPELGPIFRIHTFYWGHGLGVCDSYLVLSGPCMPLEDVEFLQQKGALTIPDATLREALIQAYLEDVHPLLPVINIEDFVESLIEENELNLKISFLFLQAVMFAGSAYVDWSLLAEAGFKSRKGARETLYQRVRVCICAKEDTKLNLANFGDQFDCEKDGLVNIQSLLLMTMWHDETEERTNIRQWMDLAISHAFAQSLNIDPRFNRSAMSLTVRRLRRRIWWSCFIRDRLISFAMRTPPRIKDEYYNVSMLEFADFQSEHMHANASAKISAICSYFGDKTRRTTLARLCIAQARLCRSLRFTALSVLTQAIAMTNNNFSKRDASDHLIADCHRDLLEWYDTLCHGDLYQPILSDDIHPDGSANLELNRAVLHMIYHAGVLRLHHSRISDTGTSPGDKELSKTFVQHSAKRISEITSNIQELGLDRFLLLAAISTTNSAISVHFLEIRGIFRANVFDSQKNYQRCLEVIKSMKEIYSTPECSSSSSNSSGLIPHEDDICEDIDFRDTDGQSESRDWSEFLHMESTAGLSPISGWRDEGTPTQSSPPKISPVEGLIWDLDDNFVLPG